jgi:hypothetical protein
MAKIFISHSHQDKAVARRIARFLSAYGLHPWLDERELRLGSQLDDTIRSVILASDAVVVVASSAGGRSKWVEREVSFATTSEPPISVCPIYLGDVEDHPFLAPHLGLTAREPHRFVEVLERLAEAFVGRPLPEPDRSRLEAGLDELGKHEARIALLADSCMRGEGLAYEHVQLIADAPFHELDEALDSISRLTNRDRAAQAAAALFSRSGAGTAALLRYMGSGHDVLGSAVGMQLEPQMIAPALQLLNAASAPADQALASFLWKNSKLVGEHRDTLLRLVTHPYRGPGGFGADAAAAAFDALPDEEGLVILWGRWIRAGLFDDARTPAAARPRAFAHWCARGLQKETPGWSRVFDLFVQHVRQLARIPSREKVNQAVDHMTNAAKEDNPRLREIVQACTAAPGSAEWNNWSEQDEMGTLVSEFASEALGERHWVNAMRRVKESLEASRQLQRALAKQSE